MRLGIFGRSQPAGAKERKRFAPRVTEVRKQRSLIVGRPVEFYRAELDALRKEVADKGRRMKPRRREAVADKATALVCQAAEVVLGLSPHDGQVMAGLTMFDGHIIEMDNGEGKTLAATIPVFLYHLFNGSDDAGKPGPSVHIVTANEHLAIRDACWMGPLYESLGLSVAALSLAQPEGQPTCPHAFIAAKSGDDKRRAYACDVLYAPPGELCFDYLLDHMKFNEKELCQRALDFVLIDEVDFILVDSARQGYSITRENESTQDYKWKLAHSSSFHSSFQDYKYQLVAALVEQLQEGKHYTTDEKRKSAHVHSDVLQDIGEYHENDRMALFTKEYQGLIPAIDTSLMVQHFYKIDHDYIIHEGKITPLDKETGRPRFGQKFSSGVHQALEVKNGMNPTKEAQELASITQQHYFTKYAKLAGMSGTALENKNEFTSVYGTPVVWIPPREPSKRVDKPDRVFKTSDEMFSGLIQDIAQRHQKGQPVLVGVLDIPSAELTSDLLHKVGVTHNVLHAKHHAREAQIIEQAGWRGAVTVAALMAGRGTDIQLGPGVEELGGLHVIGVERHEERRSDRQLRGRAGRHGKPGSSQFYLALDCDLLRLFGSDKFKGMMERLGMDDGEAIDSEMVAKAIERAQARVCKNNYDARRWSYQIDGVLNDLRTQLYSLRQNTISSSALQVALDTIIENIIHRSVQHRSARKRASHQDVERIVRLVNRLGKHEYPNPYTPADSPRLAELTQWASEALHGELRQLQEDAGEVYNEVLRYFFLESIDKHWITFLKTNHRLHNEMSLHNLNEDEKVAWFRSMSGRLFDELLHDLEFYILNMLFHLKIQRASDGDDGNEDAPVEPPPLDSKGDAIPTVSKHEETSDTSEDDLLPVN